MSRTSLLRGASVCALSLVLVASASRAQEVLPEIEIGAAQRAPVAGPPGTGPSPASQAGSLTVPSVAQLRRDINQTVGSVAFVDTNTPEMQTRYVHDLRDALKDAPGVYTEIRYGQELRLSIRGSNLTRDYHLRGLELLQDGIPLNFADGSGDMYEIDPRYYRAIEIYKGGNALAYGGSTLGGAVNFISPTAYTALAPNLVAFDSGSFGTMRGQVQTSRVIGNFDFLVNGTFTHADGYRAHSESDYTQLNGNFGYRFSKDLETRFYFGVYDTWQQLPGQLTLSQSLADPTQSLAPFPPQFGLAGFGANEARNVQNWRISNKTTLQTAIGQLDINSWYIHNYLYHPIFVVIQQDTKSWGFFPKLTSKFEVAGHRNELITGGRIWGGSGPDQWYTNYNGMKLNAFGKSWTNFVAAINPGVDPAIRNNSMNALNLEAFFENRFYLAPQLALMFGAKYFSDMRGYAVLGGIPFQPLPAYSERTYHAINPKVGLMFEPDPNMQFFADVTSSRDVPDFIDLTQGFFPPPRSGPTFTPLAAQKAWTGEIGARGKWDRFAWDVTFYHSELQDELLKFTQNPGAGIPATTFNAKRTMHQGVEFGASVDLLRDLSGPGADDVLKLSQVWTWNDFRFVGNAFYGDNPLPGIPRHVLRTTLSYARPDGAYIAPSVDWVPEGAFVDYAHTLQAPGYVLLGLQAGMKIPGGVTLYVDARNLTNRYYVSDVTTIANARGMDPRAFYPGFGRAVFAGMRLTF